MKKIYFLLVIVWCVGAAQQLRAQSCGVSAIYGGGPYYKLSTQTIPEIKASGFTTAVVWTIHIDTAGDLNFNAEFLACSGGQYVGAAAYPDFPANMALLKTQPTSVTRIEFGLSAAGSTTFANIKTLIAAQGTGPTSILYRNFKALKDTIPDVDAMNFDDETTYDVTSSVKFSTMLSDLGYKVTLCPYTNSSYWTSVASQTNGNRPGTVDAVFLQCYSGGSGNSPCSGWTFAGGIPVYPGLWDSNYTPSGVYTKMAAWKTQCAINGGFMWLYDDFHGTPKTAQYANAIDSAIGIGAPPAAISESPPDSAINISITDTLRWAGTCAQSKDVYFGTTNPPPFVINQTDTNYVPGTLLPNTTYYWRIDEKNFFGTTTGTTWRFTTSGGTGVNDILSNGIGISSYPNPFSDQTTIVVNVAEKSEITISVFNILGEEVAAIANKLNSVGLNTFTWKGQNSAGEKVSAGIYLMRVTVNGINGISTTSNIRLLYLN